MRRQDLWREQYRLRPYLRHTPLDELNARFRDVVANLTTLTEDGKLGSVTQRSEMEYWLSRLEHLFEEYRNRGGLPYGLLQKKDIIQPTFPDQPKAAVALEQVCPLDRKLCLVKFGRREHMAEMYDKGRIRIAPASSYSDPSLNLATKDDELHRSVVALGSELSVVPVDPRTESRGQELELVGNAVITWQVNDYYVYCLSGRIDIRLFSDFDADACVILRDRAAFEDRLRRAVHDRLSGWRCGSRSVEYFDPYDARNVGSEVWFRKHFRYWYQQEWRFVWLPPAPQNEALVPFFVELGSLASIADLVTT